MPRCVVCGTTEANLYVGLYDLPEDVVFCERCWTKYILPDIKKTLKVMKDAGQCVVE